MVQSNSLIASGSIANEYIYLSVGDYNLVVTAERLDRMWYVFRARLAVCMLDCDRCAFVRFQPTTIYFN